jgi:hypothetical protein
MTSEKGLALSWAEVLLILLIVIGGFGVWSVSAKLVTERFEQSPATPESKSAGGEEDDTLRRMRGDVDRLRAALLEEKMQIAREQAVQSYLLDHYPALRKAPPAGAARPPDSVRGAFEDSERGKMASESVRDMIATNLSATEAAFEARERQLRFDAGDRANAARKSKLKSEASKTRAARIIPFVAVLALLLVVWLICKLLCRENAINPNRVVKYSVVPLTLMIIYEVFGPTGLMVVALLLVLLVVRAAGARQ